MKELEDIRSQVEVFLKNYDWIKWVHFGVPDEEGATRDKIRDELAVFFHCKKCTALSGCYFALNNMPKYPLHDNCDCIIHEANDAIYFEAYCDVRKFTEYIFTDLKTSNGKLDIFNSWGYSIVDSAYLKQEIERQAYEKYTSGDYILGELDEYGQRIKIEITLNTKYEGRQSYYTGWMIHPLGKISCNTPFAGAIK